MCILPRTAKPLIPPNIYLCGSIINFVDKFRYLGHIISNDCTDDWDIERETRSLYIRGNTIVKKFGFLDENIKCSLFKSYCYSLYTCSLWVNYRQSTMNKMRVAYNNVLRKLLDVPPRCSISAVFVSNNLRGFWENIRYSCYSLRERVVICDNSILKTMLRSDCYVVSAQRITWHNIIYRNPTNNVYLI